MIDKVILYRIVELDTSSFTGLRQGTYRSRDGVTRSMFACNINNIRIAYYPDSRIFRISGRLINFSLDPNRVDNLDVLWAGIEHQGRHQSLEDLINDFNHRLYDMTGTELDIRAFTVSYIECCFNIRTEHHGRYVEVFNRIYERDDSRGIRNSYHNYALENNRPLNTSFYITTNSDQERINSRTGRARSFIINFYNKRNQLEQMNLENQGQTRSAHASDDDLRRSENILRLEVQCSTYYLRTVCQRCGVNRTFQSFLAIDMCRYVIEDKYRYFISRNHSLDFYPYIRACNTIDAVCDTTLSTSVRRSLRRYLTASLRGHSGYSDGRTQKRYNAMLERLGIYSYVMPASMGNEVLRSPMALLDDQIGQLRSSRQQYIERHGETVPWPIHTNDEPAFRPNTVLEDFINDIDLSD